VIPQMKRIDQFPAQVIPIPNTRKEGACQSLYVDGEYLARNPGWHVHESAWKAKQILGLLRQNHLAPKTICDVGCGAGEVLRQLQENLGNECNFWGYDISPQAYALARRRANERLHFARADFCEEETRSFDLILLLDVIEHLEDYFSFLRRVKQKGGHKIFHIPLDLSVQTVLRKNALIKRREMYAHVHYFTKQTALRTLEDTGYRVLDYVYTARSIEFASEPWELALKLPRRLCFAIDQDLAAQVLGGFSLLVLAR
jgi:cyclopropane fatty-acyl-phospholipid synthase-like methyltransferase